MRTLFFIYILTFFASLVLSHGQTTLEYKQAVVPLQWKDLFTVIGNETQTIDTLLDQLPDTDGSSALAKMSIKDLADLVRESNMPGRAQLTGLLGDLVHDVHNASSQLTRLKAAVVFAADTIVAVDDYAVRTSAAANGRQATVERAFAAAISSFTDGRKRIRHEALDLLAMLGRMGKRLGQMRAVVQANDTSANKPRDDVLAYLWVALGGKRLPWGGEYLAALASISVQRKQALAAAATVLRTLQRGAEDMAELRERVPAHALAEGMPDEVLIHLATATMLRVHKDLEEAGKQLAKEAMGMERLAAELSEGA